MTTRGTTLIKSFLHPLAGVVLLGMAGVALPTAALACNGCFYRVAGVAVDDVLYMRTGPSASAAIVGAIPYDEKGVTKVGPCKGKWCRVEWDGTVGWVNMRFLRIIGAGG